MECEKMFTKFREEFAIFNFKNLLSWQSGIYSETLITFLYKMKSS